MPNRRTILCATASAAVTPLVAWGQGASSAAPGDATAPGLPAIGTRLALPPVPLIDGSTFAPDEANGRVLVLYWWASWCPFCALQSPQVERLWRAGRERGLRVLALSIDARPENAAAYLRRKGYTFPAAMVSPALAAALPKPKGLPVTVVRGRDGRIVFAEGGEMFPEDVEGLSRFL